MIFSSLEERYRQRRDRFLLYACAPGLSESECRDDAAFFTAPPVRELLDFCEQHPKLKGRLATDLGARLSGMDLFRACQAGLLIGRCGEAGFSSPAADEALADCFLRTLGLCLQAVDLACGRLHLSPEALIDRFSDLQIDLAAFFQTDPEPVKACCGMPSLSAGLLSRLAGSRPLRERLRGDTRIIPFCEQYGELFGGALALLPGILRMAEEGLLLLISVEGRVCAEVAFGQVDSNFLLFTLLQNLLYREKLLDRFGAPKFVYDPALDKFSRHLPLSKKEALPDPLEDNAGFDYALPGALRPDGSCDVLHLLWGEGSPRDLPLIDGRAVLLLAPLSLPRRWGEDALRASHPLLRPHASLVRLLDDSETARWIERIRTV